MLQRYPASLEISIISPLSETHYTVEGMCAAVPVRREATAYPTVYGGFSRRRNRVARRWTQRICCICFRVS